MNRSGQSVVALALFYKILPHQILLAHDELDLPPGSIKLKLGGGTAGHNGLKDTQARMSTPEFWRLRIGIGHPRELQLEQDVADFVLHRPRKEEATLIDAAIERGQGIVDHLVSGRFEAAMLKLHTR
jgi:PTH1 family peptidyl-tRNA hydrolase